MLIPSRFPYCQLLSPSLSRRVNANSQRVEHEAMVEGKLIKKGEC